MKLYKYQYLAIIAVIIFGSIPTLSQQQRWEKLPSPAFGRVTSMTVGDSLVYVATLQGSIFVSRNEGESWELATKGLTPEPTNVPGSDTLTFTQKLYPFLEDFEVIPFIAIKNILLVDSYNGKCDIHTDNGSLILRSTNQGKTWRHILGETKFLDDYDKRYYESINSPIFGVKTYPANLYFTLDTLVYIKSQQGYYVSHDYGLSWKLLPPLSVTHSTISPQYCNSGYYAERGDLHKRLPELKDQSGRYIQLGEHIFMANTDGSLRLVSSPSVLPILSHKNKWFRLNGKNLEISIDKGFTWQVTATLPVQPERLVVNNASLLVISASQNHRSSDEGKTWEEIPQSPDWLGCRVQGIGSSFLLRSTSGTVYRLKGNETIWRLSEQGLESVYYNAVVATDSVMIVSTIPSASSFERKCRNMFNTGGVFVEHRSQGFLESQYSQRTMRQNTLFRSLDNGKKWEVIQNNLSFQSFASMDNTIYGSTAESVYGSSDRGLTWNKVFDHGGILYNYSHRLYLHETDINKIYRFSESQNLWVNMSVQSDDRMRSLRLFNDTLFCRFHVWYEKKAYYFSDKSNVWELDKSLYGVFDSIFTNDWFKGLFLNSHSFTVGKYYFLSLPYPLFHRTNESIPLSLLLFTHDAKGNVTWIPKADSGLAPGTFVISMTQHKDTLYAATDNGLYRAVLPKTTSVQVSHEVLQPQIELSVAPQPSSDKVRIYTTLPEAGFMELKVFSFQGECIGTVTTGRYPAGTHEFVWETSGYPSGTYMLQLRTTKERRYAKVSVVK